MTGKRKLAIAAIAVLAAALFLLIYNDRASIIYETRSPYGDVSVYVRQGEIVGLGVFTVDYRLSAVRWYGIIPVMVLDEKLRTLKYYLREDDISVDWREGYAVIDVDNCEHHTKGHYVVVT